MNKGTVESSFQCKNVHYEKCPSNHIILYHHYIIAAVQDTYNLFFHLHLLRITSEDHLSP